MTFSDVPGAALTPLTVGNRLATLELRAGQLSVGRRYVRCRLTVSHSNAQVACLALGGSAIHKPGNQQAHSSVAEQFVMP